MTAKAEDETPRRSEALRTFLITTAFGQRSWQAADRDHAREQHHDAFAGQPDEDIEAIEEVQCISGPDGCAGPVEYRSTGRGSGAWPRCTRHAEDRQLLERDLTHRLGGPTSPCPPVGFDPDAIGETWEEQ